MMNQGGGSYPSDLTEHQWNLIKHMIPTARSGGRPRTTCMRSVLNAIFYINRTGCPWRYLPPEFPPWKTVYNYFLRWQQTHLWKKMNDLLVRIVRVAHQKEEFPSCLIADSQTAKAHYGGERGFDGFKKMRGRKRQILVDTLGLLHNVHLHAADRADCKEGAKLFENFEAKRKVNAVFADRGYRGYFVDAGFKYLRVWPEIVGGKHDSMSPKRWIVERTFAWFNFYRRLSRDYERSIKNSEAMIYIAMIQLMLRKPLLESVS